MLAQIFCGVLRARTGAGGLPLTARGRVRKPPAKADQEKLLAVLSRSGGDTADLLYVTAPGFLYCEGTAVGVGRAQKRLACEATFVRMAVHYPEPLWPTDSHALCLHII